MRIRSSYRDNPVDPARDWLTLIGVLAVGCVGVLFVSVSLFRSARADAEFVVARGSGVETIDRALLKETIVAFRTREAKTQRLFGAPPAFTDPSR